jgi:hypothetical protein
MEQKSGVNGSKSVLTRYHSQGSGNLVILQNNTAVVRNQMDCTSIETDVETRVLAMQHQLEMIRAITCRVVSLVSYET